MLYFIPFSLQCEVLIGNGEHDKFIEPPWVEPSGNGQQAKNPYQNVGDPIKMCYGSGDIVQIGSFGAKLPKSWNLRAINPFYKIFPTYNIIGSLLLKKGTFASKLILWQEP